MSGTYWKRRDFLRNSALSGGALAASSLLPRAAFASTPFTLASAGGSWLEKIQKVFVEEAGFAAKNDVEMSYFTQVDAVMVAQAMSNVNTPVFDVLTTGKDFLDRLVAADVLLEIDKNIVTNWDDIYPQFRFGNHFASYTVLCAALAYNTKHVSKPEGWKDMWNPKYAGHVGVMSFGWDGHTMLQAINKSLGGDEDNLRPGLDAMAELMSKQKAIVVNNAEHATNLFRQGEVWIMPLWDGRIRALQDEGHPIDYIWPKDWPMSPDASAAVKNIQSPKIAMEWINLTLDPVAQVEFMKLSNYSCTNSKAEIPDELKRIQVPASALELMVQLDSAKMVRDQDKNLELWNKEVLGAA
jgi:putative spermidine/putrescine transport system substrate-binding protein